MDLELMVKAQPGTITENFKELKQRLDTEMQKYQDAVVSADNIKDAKKSLADLRKLLTACEEKRKSIKKEYAEPYMEFETKYKVMLESLYQVINNIDEQIKALDKAELDQKMTDIEELLDERLAKEEPGFEAYMRTMTDLRSPRWVNKTVSLKQIATEIDVSIQTVRKAMAVLDDGTQYAPQVLAYYADHGNLADAIQYRKKLEADDARYAAMQKEKEMTQQANAPVFEPGMPTLEPTPASAPVPTPAPVPGPSEDGYQITIPYTVTTVGEGNPRVKLVFEIDAPIQYIKFLKDTSEALEIGTMTRIKRTPQKENN